MVAIILRIIKQMVNDKRSLALILFAPILILSFMYLIFGEPNYTPKLAAIGVPEKITKAIENGGADIIKSEEDIDTLLKDRKVDAVLYIKEGKMSLKMYEPNSIKTSKITKVISTAMESLNPNAQKLDISFLYGNAEGSTFDSLAYAFLSIFSFMFVFLISGISFIRERTLGTMERFMLAPISRHEVVLGFILGFGFFAVLQSILLVVFIKYALGVTILGPLGGVVLIMVLLSFVAVSLGAVVSVFANNEFQVVQFIPVVIVPQIFFSGLIPVDTLPYGLNKLAYIMPVYYASSSLNEIMVKGSDVLGVLPYCIYLLVFILVLYIGNVVLLKKYRTI